MARATSFVILSTSLEVLVSSILEHLPFASLLVSIPAQVAFLVAFLHPASNHLPLFSLAQDQASDHAKSCKMIQLRLPGDNAQRDATAARVVRIHYLRLTRHLGVCEANMTGTHPSHAE